LLNCITETLQVTAGRKHFLRRSHFDLPCLRYWYWRIC